MGTSHMGVSCDGAGAGSSVSRCGGCNHRGWVVSVSARGLLTAAGLTVKELHLSGYLLLEPVPTGSGRLCRDFMNYPQK